MLMTVDNNMATNWLENTASRRRRGNKIATLTAAPKSPNGWVLTSKNQPCSMANVWIKMGISKKNTWFPKNVDSETSQPTAVWGTNWELKVCDSRWSPSWSQSSVLKKHCSECVCCYSKNLNVIMLITMMAGGSWYW